MPRADISLASFTVIVPITSPKDRSKAVRTEKQHQCIRSPHSACKDDDECLRNVLPGSEAVSTTLYLQKDACRLNDNIKEIDAVVENSWTLHHHGEDKVDDGAQQQMDEEEQESMSMRWTTGMMHSTSCTPFVAGTENQHIDADHRTASPEEENEDAVDEIAAGAGKGQTPVKMEDYDSLEAPHVEVCVSLAQRTTRLVCMHPLAY